MKKTTKKQAFKIITDLLNEKGDNLTISRQDLERLAGFFLPPLPAIAKTREQWAAKALTKAIDTRDYLKFLHVENGKLVGADGHRAHVVDTDLPDGFYDARLNPVDHSTVGTDLYPDITPLLEARTETRIDLDNCKTEIMPNRYGKMVKAREFFDENGNRILVVNESHFGQASNQKKLAGLWLGKRNGTRFLHGKSEFGEFVISELFV